MGWMKPRGQSSPVAPKPTPDKPLRTTQKSLKNQVKITFGTNMATISTMDLYELDQILAVERAFIDGVGGWTEIRGHTDTVGSAEVNLKLSRDRATSVANAIKGAFGINFKMELTTSGLGEDEALNDGHPDEEECFDYRKVEVAMHGFMILTTANKGP